MSVIYLLLALSICVAIIFFVVFLLSVKRGQYDDLHSPAVRMLFEDELVEKTSNNLTSKNQKS
ncbi:MAG: cbb3-type cytochrome oxidase assembly protein CcoS [Mesonia hippocampi]|uniref:cbb3-type cytochrome oxidase assembly protein CcoS n=1 Tax=Mesonia hippocampi TaxID=1628250 RepID=UPI003F9AD36E